MKLIFCAKKEHYSANKKNLILITINMIIQSCSLINGYFLFSVTVRTMFFFITSNAYSLDWG